MAEIPEPEGLCPVAFLDNLDICDLNNYQHPPFMWTLWYLSLITLAVYEKIKELLEGGGGGEGGEGGDEGGDEGGKEGGEEGEGEPEEAAEEAPAEG